MHRTLLIILLSSVCLAQSNPKPAAKKGEPKVCVAGPDEQCPPEAWQKDYEHMRALTAPYTPAPPPPPKPMPPDVRDLANGIGNRLFQEIPKGFHIVLTDPEHPKFAKGDPPQAPTSAPPPPTAQPPEPKK